MNMYEHLWKSMEINETPWTSIKIQDSLQNAPEINSI